jgi:transposase
VRRVDDRHERGVRVDTMTAVASVTPAGMCQLGYSKEHHPDLLPVKSAVSGLDPLGSPWTTTVVVGHTSDTPISLPEIA